MSLNLIKSEFESLKGDHPIYKAPLYKIYGPYENNKDHRRRLIIYDGTNRITISYPRFIIECKLNRKLEDNEEVHHMNEIEFDDRLANLEVVNSTDHRKSHVKSAEGFKCPICGSIFWLEGIRLSRMKSERRRYPDMKGPYCSRSCSGKVNN